MKKLLALLALLLVLGTTSCASLNDDRGVGDAGISKQHEDHRQVWVNIDHFPNVVAFCVGKNGVYTTTREAAPVVIPTDPNCAEGGILVGKS